MAETSTIRQHVTAHPWRMLGMGCVLLVVLPVLVLILAQRQATFDNESQFRDASERVAGILERRFLIFSQQLRSLRGLFSTHPLVTPGEWASYTAALADLPTGSVAGVGWAPAMEPSAVPDFLAQQPHLEPESITTVDGNPATTAFPVQYIHPLKMANRFKGLDLNTEPAIADALSHAIVSGKDTLSAHTNLRQLNRTVFLLLPIQNTNPASAEHSAIHGVVFLFIDVQRLLMNVYSFSSDVEYLELFDGPPSATNSLAATGAPAADQGHQLDLPCQLGGRAWTIRSQALPVTGGWSKAVPWLFGGGTLGLGMLAMLLMVQFHNRQARARRMAERMTIDLRLAQRELTRTLVQAREAAAAKDEFLAVMSHELRTPLNGVIGMTTLLLDSQLDSQQRDFAETSRSCAVGLLEVINDILDYSKLEAGKVALESLPFDPRDLLEEVLQVVADRAHAKNLELVGEVDPRLGERLRGDPSRLRQLLLNLVSNAVKFTDQGEVFVSIRLIRDDPQRPLVRFSVRDTGIGVEPDQLRSLFEPFTQADNSISRRFGGTGLGLAISKRLVEAMGGRISASSAMSQGSEFAAELVLLREEPSTSTHGQPELFGRLVLLVDDHPSARSATASILVESGCDVIAVPDLVEARAMLGSSVPEIAVIDAAGPDDDPTEVAHRFHAMEEFAQVPLLLLTSFVRQHPSDQLGVGYASKPVRRRQLRNICASLLGSRRSTSTGLFAKRFDGLQVLIADARLGNLRVMSSMLSELGCRVDLAADSDECIAAAERVAYAVIIIAADLPPRGALDIATALRRHRSSASLIIAGGPERTPPPDFEAWVPSPPRASHLVGLLTRAAKRSN